MLSRLFRRVSASITTGRTFAGPAGKRLYAVGDVHGRLDLLDRMLADIAADIEALPIDQAVTVFLGDLIDRGPDSAGVVERLRKIQPFPAKTLFLLGNHEESLLRVLEGESGLGYDWLKFGGDACVESYGVSAAALQALGEEQIADVLREAIPMEHVAFIRSFGDTFRFGDYLLVHAGIRPGVPIEHQEPKDLRWIRDPFLGDEHYHGVKVIHGHTISDGIELRDNRIGIDTGAYKTGILTAAVIEGTEVRFLSTGG